MAKVLQNFLIGIGLDTEQYDKGAKNVEGSLGRMRTSVGFTGAAITGAFATVGGAAISAGKRIDGVNIAAEKLRTPAEYVYAYGRALVAMGGDAEDAMASISSLEARLADMREGGTGRFAGDTDLALAGVDINPLREAQTGADFLRELAQQVPELNQEERRRVQETLGLSDAVMISLSKGVDHLDAEIARASDLLGSGFQGATQAARDFNRELSEINTRLQGVSDTLAENVLPGFTGLLQQFGGFIDQHRDRINEGARVMGEHSTATSLMVGGGLAAGSGALLRGVGAGGLGKVLTRAGAPGMAIGAGMMAWDLKPDDIEGLTGYRPSDYIFDNTPLDAARDAYNKVADKYGFEPSVKGSGVISYLEGSYDRFNDQVSSFEEQLLDYAASGGRNKEAEAIAVSEDPEYLPINQVNYHDGYRPEPIVESPSSGFVAPYESIYGGGEVSNAEAARSSPDVITIRDQRQQADNPIAPPRLSVDNNLDIQLEIDGRAIDTRVVDVIERRERDTIDDIYSSVDR